MSTTTATASLIDSLVANPLTFMAANLIIVPFEGAAQDTNDDPLDLVLYSLPVRAATAVNRSGEARGLYFLTAKGGVHNPQATQVESFKGYFCPYRSNDTLGTVISNKSNVMFTAAMDGCSFGVGSVGPDGARMVYHSNLASKGKASQPALQGQFQDTTLNLVLGARTEFVFSPSDYRVDSTGESQRSTTFGVRNKTSGAWSFYSQTYTDQPGSIRKLVLKAVVQVH